MRTTVDLSDDLHRQAVAIARDTSGTLSETVAYLMRRELEQRLVAPPFEGVRTGLPLRHLVTVITTEDVRTLDDDLGRPFWTPTS